jgi:disulfide bond formation protein DsbB
MPRPWQFFLGKDNGMTRESLNLPQPVSPSRSQSSPLFSVIRANLGYVAWLQALIATSGSLYFSEVLKFVPCSLCWYQRILMYPLVLIIAVGILLRDHRLRYYVLPLSTLGFGIALYHNLLTHNIISEGILPCTAGVSCTVEWINWLGFITIPLLSLTAFSVITLAILFYHPETFTEELTDE